MRPIPVDDLAGRLGRWSAGRGPLHLLLACRLRELVDEGRLPAGTPLPPDRVLAAGLAVGRTTVVAAYGLLREEGRLVRRRGSGTWVAPGGHPAVDAARDGTANPMFVNLLEPPDGVLQLACAGPLWAPPEYVEAHRRALDRLGGPDLGYHPLGQPELRAALAARYTAMGVPTTPAHVLVTTGAQQALALLARALVAPGDEVLVEAPTYPGALDLLREAAAVVRHSPAGDGAAFADALARHRPALAYVMPAVQNPVGTTMPALERRRLARAAVEAGVPLIVDDVLAELAFAGPVEATAAHAPEVITVGSLSKVVWGGLRTGWVRARPALVERLARFRAVHDLGGSVLDQLAAAELLTGFDAVRDRRVALLRERHDHLAAGLRGELPDWAFDPAPGGQTLWVRLPRGDAASYAQVALRHGVAVLPGGSLDPSGGSGDRLRIAFTADPAVLDDAVAKLAAAWRAHAAEPAVRPVLPVMAV
ncbi:PLP-dependent aminotransferase family protein [Saccharothrix longispora]|uniref:aminotransferase-like domain-containing protein n=1 Tax=Saccharothrix longispora TaxID=33920 RepID=UPI0028FD59C1|nr:PLP-dependent aminotransferase family protein [Saccharothrix longispora]MBY8849210.1 PLP-dependent aminotransferase family protein [Saccharothrix sp. MB29]MDU0290778.1 PLP-dependent aminotransferase family protein [Saccharothrix longispora]